MNRFMKATLAAGLMAVAACSYAAPANPSAAPAASAAMTATNTNVNVSPEERAKIEQVVREYLLRKPEILIEAMQVLQQRQYEQAQQTLKDTQKAASNYVSQLFHQSGDPVAGNPNGKITVTEFFDYQCPHCIDMAPVIDGIIKANPDVRIVFKDFPIRGPMSDFAARAAVASNMQGKYYEFSHALLTSKQEPLTQDIVYQLAKDSGLNVDKLKKDMNSPAVDKTIKDNMKLAQSLKLMGTPALFVGKTDAKPTDTINYVPGQVNQKQLQDMIDKTK